MNDINEICNIFKSYKSFAFFTHVNADGDAIGSILSLGKSLELLGKKVIYSVPEPVPLKYNFLKGYEYINKKLDLIKNMEVGVLLDAPGTERIDDLEKYFPFFKITINIDHHLSNGRFATYNLVNEKAPSTTAIVLEILEKGNFPIDEDISNSLYAGLLTDTGSFHYSNTNISAFQTASKLINYGAKISYIADMLFECETISHFKMLGISLLRLIDEDGIAYSYITRNDFIKYKAKEEDTERIIDVLRRIKDAKIILFFKEMKSEETRVSIRGKNGLNVRELAEYFGGGGHLSAAGFTIHASIEESIKLVTTFIKEKFKSYESQY
jgi:phosphoesterase RecJ-like protein